MRGDKFLQKLRGDHMPVPPRARSKAIALAALACALTVGLLALASTHWHTALLMAPLGASCFLVMAYPDGFFAQPRNVVGGHVLSSIVGLGCLSVFGAHTWSLALAVGLAVALTMWVRVPHPPAGANAIVIFLTLPDWTFVIVPTLIGAAVIVLIGVIFLNLTREQRYPKYW